MLNSTALLVMVFLIAIDSFKSHETTCSTCREKYKALFGDMLERVKSIKSHNALAQLYTNEKEEISKHLEDISELVNNANKNDETSFFWFLKPKNNQSEFLKKIEKLNEEVQGHINKLCSIVDAPQKVYYQPSMIGETYQIISELDQIIKTLEEQLRQKSKNTIDRSHSSDITIHVCFDGCWRTVGEPANGLIEGKRFSGPASNNLSVLGSIFGENVLGLCVELNTKQEIEEKIFKEENKKGKRALDKHTPQIERELKVESLPQFCSKLLQMHLDEVNEHHPSKRIFKEYPIANGTITHIGSAVSNPDNFFGKFHTNHSQEEEKGADKAKTGSQEIKNGKEKVKPGTQGPLLQGLYSAANYVSGFGFGRSASKRAEHEN